MVVSYSRMLFSRQQPPRPRQITEPKFSIVARARDRAEFLSTALHAIERQHYVDFDTTSISR